MNGKIFGKDLLKIKCVFIFSLALLRNIPQSEKNLTRYYHKFALVFM